MLGAQSVRKRYVLFHVGDLRAVRHGAGRRIGQLPFPPSTFEFIRVVIIVIVVIVIVIMLLIFAVISVPPAAPAVVVIVIVSLRGTGDAVRMKVRDAQDSAVAEDVRLAERVHAADFVLTRAALEYVRSRRHSRVAGAPCVPGHHHDGHARRAGGVGVGGGGGPGARARAVRRDVG